MKRIRWRIAIVLVDAAMRITAKEAGLYPPWTIHFTAEYLRTFAPAPQFSSGKE
jgi:hypothetical protein